MAKAKIEGMNELQSRLKSLGVRGRLVENSAVKAGGRIVKKRMKQEVTVSDKKHLHIRDDIQMSGVRRKDGIPHVDIGPKETAWRAKFLEFGTKKMSPNPFISRSEKLSEQDVGRTIERELKKGLGL